MTSKGEKGILTLYSDVQATSVRWLWYPFIAVGKITLLQGDPGDGIRNEYQGWIFLE